MKPILEFVHEGARLNNAALQFDCARNPDGGVVNGLGRISSYAFFRGAGVAHFYDDRRSQAGTLAANRIAADALLRQTQTRSVQPTEFRKWRYVRQVAEPNMKPILEFIHRDASE
jgi:hypothetical protein